MHITEISRIERLVPDTESILGFSIELPLPETSSNDHCFDLSGWVLGRGSRIVQIEVGANDGSVRTIPINYPRADVAAVYPSMDPNEKVGFRASISLVGMSPEFELWVEARMANGQTVSLARIQGCHRPIVSGFTPMIQPLLVTSLGRMGTTWMMRLLSEHPAIAVLRIHPYETRPGKYWMQLLAKAIWKDEPLWNDPLSRFSDAAGDQKTAQDQRWFRTRFVERIAASCQRSIEECYREVAVARNQPCPLYFAEKHIPDEVPGIIWELYPKTREIFIVRDLRDMLCSIRAFNAKHGISGFNRDQVNSDEQYIYRLGEEAARLLRAWQDRRNQTCLVRYEDLISQPAETLQRVLTYLEIEASPRVVTGILERALANTAEMESHKTAGSARDSIARWQSELDEKSKLVCDQVFGRALTNFGYALK